MRSRPWASHVDMYRKIPTDLLEGTKRGSIMSYISLGIMILLFLYETSAFFSTRMTTYLALDRSEDPRIRLNFNITMLDLRCEWAVIDVVSVLGTDQNVTAHVTKWDVDAEGMKRTYKGRNRNQRDIDLFDSTVTETIEELTQQKEDAISLDPTMLNYFKEEHDYVFVDFFASWCSHCRILAPTWETLAEVMVDAGIEHARNHPDDYSKEDYDAAGKIQMPVVIAKVDCVQHPDLCNNKEQIQAYPTLRLFVDGKPWYKGDYRGHRTILEMVEWLYYVEEEHKKLLVGEAGEMGDEIRTLHKVHEEARGRLADDAKAEATKRWHDKTMSNKRKMYHSWNDDEHPGCQLAGHLLLDRTPGNFHILARSKSHDLAPQMTNVSHMVNSLTIGDPMAKIRIDDGRATVPKEVEKKISPMNGNVYVTENLHEAYHHYLKIVATAIDGLKAGPRDLRVYQILPQSQLAMYRNDMIPEAKFAYDLSPIAVSYRKETRRWYEYCTSIMAIIGGVFTVVGMIESSIHCTVNAARVRNRR